MQDSRQRGTAPRDPSPGAPEPRRDPAADAPAVRFAAAAAGLSVLASALVTQDALPTAVGVVLALAGIAMGIVSLVRHRRSAARTLVVSFAVIAILWGTLNALGGGSRLVVWPASEVYRDCTARSLTLNSGAQCERQLTDNVWRHLTGKPVETGAPSPSASPRVSPSASPSGSAGVSPSGSASASPSGSAATPSASPDTGAPSASATR
ncbi:hypothetical protein IUU84_09005 [Kocuria rhizophila]|uniref:hypothetical protein n=1 Tax=Kocuria rhizophila TaxID=72000 RepID=UPI00294A057E|nr:hypothetical protein [Kocuria rhizophila]MDV5999705.1 hypothetical protein [Kocuria rhizophila]